MGTDALRKRAAYFLVALADAIYPAPHIAGLANPELDTYLAGRKRR
jgi:hypothetical protein